MATTEGLRMDDQNLFHRTRAASYFVIQKLLEDEEKSLHLLRDVMKRAAGNREIWQGMGDQDLRAYIIILSAYMATRLIRKEQGHRFGLPLEFKETDEDLAPRDPAFISLYRGLENVAPMDRMILMLERMGLSDQEISDSLHLKIQAVERRKERGYQKMAEKVEHSVDETLLHSVVDAFSQRRLNAIEAMSNISGYSFTEEYSNAVLSDMANTGTASTLQKMLFGNKYLIPGILGLLLLVLLVYFLSKVDFSSKEKSGETSSSKVASSIEESVERSEEKPQAEPDSRMNIPSDLYGSKGGITIFADPQTNILYMLESGKTPYKIADLSAQANDHMGIQKIGLTDDYVTIAFLNGKGAVIDRQGKDVEVTQYWQDAWFAEKEKLNDNLQKGVIIDGVLYQFEKSE